jgi:glutathione S-transferase
MIAIFSGELTRLLGVIDRILADDREYLAGPYSIGDIMHFPWLKIVQNLQSPMLLELPRVVAWLDRIAERPAVERGMAVPS